MEDDEVEVDETSGVADFFKAVGKQIKLLRERAGLTQRDLSSKSGYGEHLISAIERGKRTPRPEFLTKVDGVLGAGGLLAVVAEDVMEAKRKMRLQDSAWSKGFAKEEADAIEIHDYCTLDIPGLLQTEAHARALYRMRRPSLTTDEVEQRVAARLARQEILARPALPVVSWVLDESVLRRPLGGWDVHEEQLRHLLKIGRMWGIELHVLPMGSEENAGMSGSFMLLTPKEKQQVAYVEVQHVNRLITDAEEVRKMAARYSSIRGQALSPRGSLALIEEILGEREHGRAGVVQEQLQR